MPGFPAATDLRAAVNQCCSPGWRKLRAPLCVGGDPGGRPRKPELSQERINLSAREASGGHWAVGRPLGASEDLEP